MEDNKLTIRKIPIRALMEVLAAAWDRGADYVDIVGKPGDAQDSIEIVILPEYCIEQTDNPSPPESTSLDGDMLNELI